jgi:hypothetical protein
MPYRVFNRKFEAWHHPGNPKGVMVGRNRAARWEDRAAAERVAAELNQRDRHPEYGELGHDDWIVVEG